MIFTFRTFGYMGTRFDTYGYSRYYIDVVAHPTNIWMIGTPGTPCMGYSMSIPGTICEYKAFDGAAAERANGFRIRIGDTPMINLGTENAQGVFSIQVRNPSQAVDMQWKA